MLREEADIFQQLDRNLFCKMFRDHLILSGKSKKQTIKLICDKGKKKKETL